MPTKNNKHEEAGGHGMLMGLAALTVAGAAAGAYFLYGSKNSAKYRSKVKGWMFKAKGEILEAMEKMENVTKEDYEKIVDMVMSKYQSISNVEMDDLKQFASDIKDQWKEIEERAHPTKKPRGKKIA